MERSIGFATEADTSDIAALRNRVSQYLARRYRLRPSCVTQEGVLREIATSRVLIFRKAHGIVATLRLATKKPWAIDVSYFTDVPALYLHNMAVDPEQQGRGLGRRLVEAAKVVAQKWPREALRLDAYDAEHGAGVFYEKCGFREVGRAVYRRVPLIYFEFLIGAKQ